MAKTTERGYGAAHGRRRAQEKLKVEAGNAYCAHPLCGKWIPPTAEWDLGHDPRDRSRYLGAMHRKCNRDTRLEKALKARASSSAARADWW